jgi:hypothetical protein
VGFAFGGAGVRVVGVGGATAACGPTGGGTRNKRLRVNSSS